MRKFVRKRTCIKSQDESRHMLVIVKVNGHENNVKKDDLEKQMNVQGALQHGVVLINLR